MRFCIGKVPPNPDFHPDAGGWRRLQEPSVNAFTVQAIAFGVLAAVVANLLVARLFRTDPEQARIVIRTGDLTLASVALGIASFLAGVAGLIVVHESIHLLVHPGQGRTRRSILGVLPPMFTFYAFYDAALTRNRFVAMVAAPFLYLTVAPLLVFAFLDPPPVWVGLVIIVNALLSGGDLAALWLVLKQVPRHAVIRHQSWDAYWKPIQSPHPTMPLST